MMLNQQLSSKRQKSTCFLTTNQTWIWQKCHYFHRKDRLMNLEKHKTLFPVTFPSSSGTISCCLSACRETSCSGELWALTSAWRSPCCKYVTTPLGRFSLAERESRASTEDVVKLLGTYVFMFVCWHFRKIAQELLGHVAHIVTTSQLLFFAVILHQ